MTPRSARAAKPAAAPSAAVRPAGAKPAAAKPAASADWNAFLASRAEALRKARSQRRRRIAMLLVFCALVLAFDPAREYAYEKYPQGTLSELLASSAAAIKSVPRRISRFFAPAGGEAAAEADFTADAPLTSASGANPNFSVSSLKSSAAILANAESGSVLLKKNADLRVYPASLTKIMTVLLAIEHREELPDRIVMEPALLQPLYDANSTMAGFLPGEAAETTDLIYGALLLSGGECAAALACAIAGSEADFAALMNARAREFGMFDTHFTNATGLHDPEHYSTVRDLAKLLLYALENESFAETFTTVEYEAVSSEPGEYDMIMTSNMFARMEDTSFAGGRILGGKTGWTARAGQCLASLAEKNGNRYIFVSTGNGVEPDGTTYSFEDARNAYENGILPAV
jgi:D-alanyl-D-alanine carboxypeptidase (penicillin-binding protein 5/6)